jgi:hypothetical protein
MCDDMHEQLSWSTLLGTGTSSLRAGCWASQVSMSLRGRPILGLDRLQYESKLYYFHPNGPAEPDFLIYNRWLFVPVDHYPFNL